MESKRPKSGSVLTAFVSVANNTTLSCGCGLKPRGRSHHLLGRLHSIRAGLRVQAVPMDGEEGAFTGRLHYLNA